METTLNTEHRKYAQCIAASKRVRWEIDADVLRGREFDLAHKFLPDGLSLVDSLPFLDRRARLFFSQVQGRTYANMFGLVERFIGVKILEVSQAHGLGDQVALEALVRFTDEELKHQELFRRIETMLAGTMPAGYRFLPQADEVAAAVLAASTWAVLGLTCHIELFTQAHYRSSIDPDVALSPLWKDVFLYHWREESQHATLDELEWIREDARLTAGQRDAAVDDLIGLVGAVDGLLAQQAAADADYFIGAAAQSFSAEQRAMIAGAFLRAYRHQYIVSGVRDTRFVAILGGMVSAAQSRRIDEALAPLFVH
ncbi:MAG TPA: hypothetical protein VFY24_00080 [Azospira sp.]|nr:hypothetical protein [Azospira sp.]